MHGDGSAGILTLHSITTKLVANIFSSDADNIFIHKLNTTNHNINRYTTIFHRLYTRIDLH